jgi:hypothetical protein
MIKILARIIVSLVQLIKNPVQWFSNRNWLTRVLLILILLPLISAITIGWYDQIMLFRQGTSEQSSFSQGDTNTVFNQKFEELQKQLDDQHQDQLSILSDLENKIEALRQLVLYGEDAILGISEGNYEIEETKQVIYIPKDFITVPVYDEPIISPKKSSNIEGGNIFFFLDKIDGWYKINLDDNSSVWIQEEYVLELF